MNVVMAGVTGSDSSKRALRWAAARAASLGAELRVVSVVSLPVPIGPPSVPGACLPDKDQMVESCLVMQRSLVDESIDGMNGLRIVNVVEVGNPIRVLPRLASDADLLVLGSSRNRRCRSIITRCLRRATCPVVVVTEEERPR